MDFSDFVRPAARGGVVLVIPANDFPGIEDVHARSALWAAVMAGVPVVRPTGHGNSVVIDAAGRTIATATSLHGPAVLVADVPISALANKREPQHQAAAIPAADHR
jgi:apolipoprotein N-acyltransferase